MRYCIEHLQGVAGSSEQNTHYTADGGEIVEANSPADALSQNVAGLAWPIKTSRCGEFATAENPDVANASGRYSDYWMASPAEPA